MHVLGEQELRFYERFGFLMLDQFIASDWLERLNKAVDEFIEESRHIDRSSASILVEPCHTRSTPRLRRIPHTVLHHIDFEAFGLRGPIVDLAEDLLGPSVRFHHSKLNFKWSEGGEEVKWHQDIQFWPHTNYSPLTIGVYLTDVTEQMAPMGVVPGSHKGSLYSLADSEGNWTGFIDDADLATVNLEDVVWLKGPAGSVTVHSCRIVHGSAANISPKIRPLLLHTYSAGDAIPITNLMDGIAFSGELVRGEEPSTYRYDDEPSPMPPDFKGSYSSIFAVQKAEAE